MADKCKECGCVCAQCSQVDKLNSDMHLHVEIENLRQRLLERDNHIVTMETQFLNEADKFPNGELASIKEEILTWQEKYSRLYDAHKRVQKVNQNLEDKLLRIVDKCETEKGALTKDIATLSHRLADANYTIHRLTQDNEKYRNDVNLAIQLLQCKPSNFVSQRYDSLPSEMQAKVRTYLAQKRRPSETVVPDVKSITVPISTFPPTAMVYNVTKTSAEKDSDDESDESKPPVDIVSAAIMAKVLEERERERIFAKHCDTCTCHRSILSSETETQTVARMDVYTCNKCGSENERNVQNSSEKSGSAGNDYQSAKNCIKYEGSVSKSYGCIENNIRDPSSQGPNEKSTSNGKAKSQSNGNSIKHSSFQLVNEKQGKKNFQNSDKPLKSDNCSNVSGKRYLNIKNSMRQQCLISANANVDARLNSCPENFTSDSSPKQATFQNSSERSASKMSVDKARQARSAKRSESQISGKPKPGDWPQVERSALQDNLIDLKTSEVSEGQKGQSQMDVINERLWKNEWSKSKAKLSASDAAPEAQPRKPGDIRIDVINDRVWRNDGSHKENGKPSLLTLIEVKTADPSPNQNDDAASPSFSSDSLVISSSDPPSSSSGPIQLASQKQRSGYNDNLKTTWQDRTAGPRGCSVRLTPCSKNILLDNAGHYQTILYTSSNSRPNTALVHAAKSSRSGRSASTSSEENSAILPADNGQLQRVAEWIQASGPCESQKQAGANSADGSVARLRSAKKIQGAASIVKEDAKLERVDAQETRVLLGKSDGLTEIKTSMDGAKKLGDKQKPEKDEDLIIFELPQDERAASEPRSTAEPSSEIKVTREMEETYLKLAASLDPVTLSLSSSASAGLTLEKYRKEHRRLQSQKIQDKAGWTT